MAAIAECTKNPMAIFNYQNDPEVTHLHTCCAVLYCLWTLHCLWAAHGPPQCSVFALYCPARPSPVSHQPPLQNCLLTQVLRVFEKMSTLFPQAAGAGALPTMPPGFGAPPQQQ